MLVGLASPGAAQAAQIVAVPPRPLGRDLPVYQPPAGVPTEAPVRGVQNPSGELTLRDALAAALLQSPDLAAYAWELRAREARTLQVARLPNPTLGVTSEDFASGLPSNVNSPLQPQTTLQLSQLVELGGKRAARRKLASATQDLAAWDYEAARMDVLTQVSRAFVDVLASQEAVALAAKNVSLAEQVKATVLARVAAGVVSPIEETKTEVALAAVRIEADRARRTLEADRRRLSTLWGSPEPAFSVTTGDLRGLPPTPDLPTLRARLAENPDLARWAAEIVQRRAALDVARAARVPDLTISGGYRRFTTLNANAAVVGVSVPLPLFDRNAAGIREAQALVSKASEEQRAADLRVNTQLVNAWHALSSARSEVDQLTAHVLPGAQQTFATIEEGYRAGKFGFLDVLDAQRTLIAANEQHLRALADLHKAAADVERLTGAALSDFSPAPAPQEQKQ
jgi:cobalt-zinc-cadmium efflux system outer membrane protein